MRRSWLKSVALVHGWKSGRPRVGNQMVKNQIVATFRPIAIATLICRASVEINFSRQPVSRQNTAQFLDSETSALNGFPAGCSPQIAFARARKSGSAADTAAALCRRRCSIHIASSSTCGAGSVSMACSISASVLMAVEGTRCDRPAQAACAGGGGLVSQSAAGHPFGRRMLRFRRMPLRERLRDYTAELLRRRNAAIPTHAMPNSAVPGSGTTVRSAESTKPG